MKHQSGATLIVALIMLIVMTLGAVLSYNLSKSSLQIVGNQQAQQQTASAARQALELAISRNLFATSPTTAFGATNAVDVDLFSGSIATVTPATVPQADTKIRVQLTPQPCIRKAVEVAIVDLSDPATQACIAGATQDFGIEQGNTAKSNCVDVIWELTAQATDSVTRAAASAVQGVALRQDRSVGMRAANFCP